MENRMPHSPETEPAAATVKKEAATFIFRCVVFNTGSGSPNSSDTSTNLKRDATAVKRKCRIAILFSVFQGRYVSGLQYENCFESSFGFHASRFHDVIICSRKGLTMTHRGSVTFVDALVRNQRDPLLALSLFSSESTDQ
jgi:hypothetical protein